MQQDEAPPLAQGNGAVAARPELAALVLGLGDLALEAYNAKLASSSSAEAEQGGCTDEVMSRCEVLYDTLNELLAHLDPVGWSSSGAQSQVSRTLSMRSSDEDGEEGRPSICTTPHQSRPSSGVLRPNPGTLLSSPGTPSSYLPFSPSLHSPSSNTFSPRDPSQAATPTTLPPLVRPKLRHLRSSSTPNSSGSLDTPSSASGFPLTSSSHDSADNHFGAVGTPSDNQRSPSVDNLGTLAEDSHRSPSPSHSGSFELKGQAGQMSPSPNNSGTFELKGTPGQRSPSPNSSGSFELISKQYSDCGTKTPQLLPAQGTTSYTSLASPAASTPPSRMGSFVNVPGLENFDLSDAGVLGMAWHDVYFCVQDTILTYDEGFLGLLAHGVLPSAAQYKALRGSAMALHDMARRSLRKLDQGHPLRLPVFSLYLFAVRILTEEEELTKKGLFRKEGSKDAAASGADENGGAKKPEGEEDDDEEEENELSVGKLLEKVVEEVEGVWKVSEGSLYGLGVANVALLPCYSLFGRVLRALRDGKSVKECYALAGAEEPWEDGMEELRRVCDEKRGGGEGGGGPTIGTKIKLGVIADYMWYSRWVGAEEGNMSVETIPSEVPVSMILADLGAPRSLETVILLSDREALQRFVLPEYRQIVESKLVKERLAWTEGVGDGHSGFELHKGRGRVAALGATSQKKGDKRASDSSAQKSKDQLAKIAQHVTTKVIKLEDILLATNSWSPSGKLGEGGFGGVYKGVAPNGDVWAVKRANMVDEESLEEFENEVASLGKMSHQHLVRLMGYYADQSERILVYEFAEKGSLASLLYRPAGSATPALAFEERLEIAVGAAEGLKYLHCFAQPPVIHRDIKSDNILLSATLQAKVADFGRLKSLGGAAKHTRVMGTPGYCDPEYSKTYMATDKSDVYSFGVVLLELLTGKKAIMEEVKKKGFFTSLRSKKGDKSVRTPTSLVSWAIPLITAGKIRQIVDPVLGDRYSLSAAKALSSVAAMCVQKSSQDRPNMAEVATRLSSIQHRIKEMRVAANEGPKYNFKPSEGGSSTPIHHAAQKSNSGKLALLSSKDAMEFSAHHVQSRYI